MTVHVRDATPDDAGSLARLRGAWDRERRAALPDDAATFADRLATWMREHPAHRAAIALDDDEPVGMAWLVISDRAPRIDAFERTSGELQSVYVDPTRRGERIGSALIAHLMAIAEREGLGHVGVHSSTEGLPLYRAAGFASSEKMMRWPAETAE